VINGLLFENGQCLKGEAQELIQQWQNSDTARLWLDLEFNSEGEASTLLAQFAIHPLAVEDALRKRHPPKIEFFDDYLFILYRGIAEVNGELDFEPLQLALFVGERFLVSLHRSKSIGVSFVRREIQQPKKNKRGIRRSHDSEEAFEPLSLALAIMHAASSVYLDNLLEFESRLSDIEDAVQQGGDDQLLQELTSHKSHLVKLRRSFSYHRGITDSLRANLHEDYVISLERYEHSINDLHDRFDRLFTLTQMHYDICGDVIEGYLSIASHRLNVAMRILTVITAVFVPLSFLAGLYGMNFENMPELKYEYAYYFLLGTMAILAITLFMVFRRKQWL